MISDAEYAVRSCTLLYRVDFSVTIFRNGAFLAKPLYQKCLHTILLVVKNTFRTFANVT